MTTIYLIRHGESEGNILGTCQGQYDELLSRRGLLQCRALRDYMRDKRLDAVYTSDLYRAAMTARTLAEPHRIDPLPEPGLREMGFGIYEGEAWGSIYHREPQLRHARVQDYNVPGGESLETLARRVTETMERLVRRHEGETIAIVSHGGAISCFLHVTFPEQAQEGGFSFVPENTGVTTLEYRDGVWKLLSFSDMTHLEKAGVPYDTLHARDRVELWFRPVDWERDAGQVCRMGRECWRAVFGRVDNYRESVFAESARRMAMVPDCAQFCMDGEETVGLLLLDGGQTDEPNIGHISLIYLEPDYRHRGVGAQLLGRATMVYRRQGRRVLRLHVAQQNRSAIRFYQKHGFRFSGLPIAFSGQLVMKKSIVVPNLFAAHT